MNIRIRFANISPIIYETLSLPEDGALLTKFNDTLKILSTDPSKDVAHPAKDLLLKIMNSSSKQNIFRWDAATIGAKRDQDRQREDEEKTFLTEWELSGGAESLKKDETLIDSGTAPTGLVGKPAPSSITSTASTKKPPPRATTDPTSMKRSKSVDKHQIVASNGTMIKKKPTSNKSPTSSEDMLPKSPSTTSLAKAKGGSKSPTSSAGINRKAPTAMAASPVFDKKKMPMSRSGGNLLSNTGAKTAKK